MERVRVAVRGSDPITTSGVISYLRTQPELHVLAEGRIADAQVLVVAEETVTAETMTFLRQATEGTTMRTVLVVSHIRDSDLLGAVECGVLGVLPRAYATSERLVRAVLSASRGRGELPPDLLGALLGQVGRLQREVLRPNGLTSSGLVPREVDVLRLMAEGWDTAEIARKLSYSERTVKSVMHTLMMRLKLRNRPHAVAYALRAGVI